MSVSWFIQRSAPVARSGGEYADKSILPAALDTINSSWDIYVDDPIRPCQRVARFRDVGPARLLSALASNTMGVKVSTISEIYSLREFEGAFVENPPQLCSGADSD